jgi:class 3 adenylate cyclase/tetratricopeptide (TPR) repeat protein
MGGTVDRVVGESVTAVFGVPRATDNDAERAVHAALAVQAALAGVSLPPRSLRAWRPSARVGIGTGRVFAGPAGVGREITVIGDAVNAAARLQQLADPGAVLIGGGTYRQVAGLFEVEPMVARSSGASVAASTDTFRVMRPAPQRLMATATDFFGLATELVGRSAEMLRVREALETVRSESRAALLTVTGPPGVGRSRILAELSSAVGKDGSASILSAQSSPLALETSYALVGALLGSAFHLRDDDAPDEIVRKLARGLRGLAGDRPTGGGAAALDRAELETLAGPVATLVGGEAMAERDPEAHGRPSDAAPSEGGGATKQRLAAAAARLLGAVVARRPLVILCDDLQWADDASLDLLDDLVLRLADQPLFVVCAARPDLYERRPHWGEGKAAHARLEIEPLARRHVEQMARDRLRMVGEVPSDFVRTLAERAEGSALILTETLHLLVDAGVVEPSVSGPWRIHETRLGALELPPTIQGIVQARLDRLDADARTALAQAAVVGKTFWLGAVAALRAADGDAHKSSVENALAELRQRRLVRVREASTLPGEQELVFAESATQEVAYASLSVRVRRVYHRAAASWLEQRARGDAAAALIAHQYDKGGDRRAAASHQARAGVHAMALGQNEQALRHLERARDIHDDAAGEAPLSDGESTASIFAEPGDARVASWRDRTRLRLDLGDVLRMLGRLDDAEAAYEEARVRVLRREARSAEPWQSSEALLWEARIDFRQALARKVRGKNQEARQLVERAIARANDAGTLDETPVMWALFAAIHRREGDLDACLAASLRGLRVCRGVLARDARFREAVSSLLVTLGGVFYSRGQLVRAERSYRQAARVVDERTQPQAASYALSDAGAVRFARGDFAGARELFLASLKLKERQGDLAAIAIARSNVAEVALCLGDVDAADKQAREAVRIARQVDARADLPDMLKNAARASLAKGDVPAALAACTEALALAEVGGGRVYLADVAEALAEICVAAGQRDRDAAVAAARALEAALAAHGDIERVAACAARCRERIAPLLTAVTGG